MCGKLASVGVDMQALEPEHGVTSIIGMENDTRWKRTIPQYDHARKRRFAKRRRGMEMPPFDYF